MWLGSGPYNDVRWWQGRRYVRTSGLGMAAIPGTSIHGNGRAIDCNDPMRSWLMAHPEYGFKATIFEAVGQEPWHFEWSPSRYTATPTPPAAPQIPTLIAPQEDDDMAAYSVHARVNPDGEWTLGHADIGSDLATFATPVTDAMKRTVYTDGGGVVVEFRGFMVTNITALGIAWARTYAKGAGHETSRPNRDGYIDIQRGLSLVAQASSKG